jgi:integrase
MSRRQPNKTRLKELILKRLKPRARPYLLWDTLQHGLAIQVQPSGNAAWKCIYCRHGRPRWYSIGRADAIGLADARRLAAKIMVQVAEGGDPQADRKAERSSGTFEELANSYVERYAKRENKSWQQADTLVKKHLIPKWGKLKAADITRSDVNAMMKRINAPIVANQVLASASAIFSWAIKKEEAGLKINPTAGADRNDTDSRNRVLSDGEVPKFWAAFENVGLVEGAALKMILLTGQRPGEVSCMRTEHIEDGWWTLPKDPIPALGWPGTKNKNKTAKQKKRPAHKVWLPKVAQQIIAEMGTSGMVFATPRGNAVNGLDADMRKICKKLGIVDDPPKPHDLRRTHGTAITGLGFGRDAMNRIQNHVDGGIADVYDQSKYEAENKKIMEAVSKKIMSLIDGVTDDNVITDVVFKKA